MPIPQPKPEVVPETKTELPPKGYAVGDTVMLPYFCSTEEVVDQVMSAAAISTNRGKGVLKLMMDMQQCVWFGRNLPVILLQSYKFHEDIVGLQGYVWRVHIANQPAAVGFAWINVIKPPSSKDGQSGSEVPVQPNTKVQTKKTVVCGEINTIIKNLLKNFGEEPLFIGEDKITLNNGTTTTIMTGFFYNVNTKTFTVVEQMPGNKQLLCVIGTGVLNTINKEVIEKIEKEKLGPKGEGDGSKT